jgi:hypothetical protein
MAKHLLTDRMLVERLLAERALRELPMLRTMSGTQALHWLNALLLDIRRAEDENFLQPKRAARAREEAVVAIGLVGIALDRKYRRSSELHALWDEALAQIRAWRDGITARAAPVADRDERRV